MHASMYVCTSNALIFLFFCNTTKNKIFFSFASLSSGISLCECGVGVGVSCVKTAGVLGAPLDKRRRRRRRFYSQENAFVCVLDWAAKNVCT